MGKLKVCYYGSCWPTNIGNSFVNLGAIQSLKYALGENAELFHFGGMSSYLFSKHGKPKNSLPFGKIADCDYVAVAGMIMCKENFETQHEIFEQFINNGAKILILGGGAEKYDEREVKEVRHWMEKIPIHGFISRDIYSFEKYGDLAKNALDGIDSAFFISESIKPPKLKIPEFVVFNFDSIKQPEIDTGDKLIIRTNHSCWPPSLKEKDFELSNTLISDLPSDYLTLYANTQTTYSDRIHACIATLSYGNQAMLFGKDVPRLRMFERLGVQDIIKKPVCLDKKRFAEDKSKQMDFLRNIIK